MLGRHVLLAACRVLLHQNPEVLHDLAVFLFLIVGKALQFENVIGAEQMLLLLRLRLRLLLLLLLLLAAALGWLGLRVGHGRGRCGLPSRKRPGVLREMRVRGVVSLVEGAKVYEHTCRGVQSVVSRLESGSERWQ